MLKGEELRLGNLVTIETSNKYQQVIDVMCDSVNTLDVEGAHYGMVEPIPLDESLLLKLGLERAEEFGKNAFWINKDWKIYYCSFNKGTRFVDKGWIADMPYLHQLQNLTHALGTELDVTPLLTT